MLYPRPEAALAWLKAHVGWREGPNNDNPFGPWQGAGNHAAYCDSGAQEAAVEQGGFDGWPDHCQFGRKGDAYTPWTEAHAKEIGLWRDKGYTPKVLDQWLADWNHNGVADHIETVVHDNGNGTFVTVGFNTGSPEGCHYVVRDNKFTLGFVAMSDVVSATAPAPGPGAPTPPASGGHEYHGILKEGTRGTPVGWLQAALNDPSKTGGDGYNLVVDNVFGHATHNAVRDYQSRHGLVVDGIVGSATWAALKP